MQHYGKAPQKGDSFVYEAFMKSVWFIFSAQADRQLAARHTPPMAAKTAENIYFKHRAPISKLPVYICSVLV
jgi:hypothetical protein